LLRFEARYLHSENDIFLTRKSTTNGMLYGTASLAISF
jgi:hypothetical protein